MLKALFFVTIACASLSLTACSSDPAPAAPTPTPGADGGTTTPVATTKKANKITGSIRDERGNVITIPGVTYELYVSGRTAAGENQSLKPPVKADGTYEVDAVALGNYRVSGQIMVPFNGKTFVLPLAGVQDNSVDQLSSDGVVQDFVWKLTGAKTKLNPDPLKAVDWYGVSVALVRSGFRADLGTGVPLPAAGTKFEFLLTPKQPKLADGSDAKEKKIEQTYSESALGANLTDIPLGVYDLSGTEISPGGERTAMVFATVNVPFSPSVLIEYRPYENGGEPVVNQFDFDIQR